MTSRKGFTRMNKTSFLSLIVALVALVAVFATRPSADLTESKKETAYERVMRTGSIRCGYADWPPVVFMKDVKTAQLSGIMHDITEEMGKRLGLKIKWEEDTGWSNIIPSLENNRTDAFCAGFWVDAARSSHVAISKALFFNAVYPFVRADDHRFDGDLMKANDQRYRLSSIDGEMTDTIARNNFPKAQNIAVPSTVQISEALNNVATNKADIIITDYGFGKGYMEANPNKLRLLMDKPFQVFQTSYAFDIRERTLRDVIDGALIEMQNQGVVEQIIHKYSQDDKAFLLPALPYRP